jgi:hypothetical protein
MKTTFEPDLIYAIFAQAGFPVLRIDEFDRGNFAKIRAEIPYKKSVSIKELLNIALKLNALEEQEKIEIQLKHLDLVHGTIRLDIQILPQS